MPYICMTRDDVPNGVIQILDLFPNTSKKNHITDGKGQTQYVNRAVTQAVLISGTSDKIYGPTSGQDAIGLHAFVADTFEISVIPALLTADQVSDAVDGILGILDNATADMTLANIKTAVLAGTYGDLVANFNESANFAIENLLKVLAGAHYKIAKGTTLVIDTSQGEFVFHSKATNLSSADTVIKADNVSGTGINENTPDYFNISLNEGQLASLAQAITLYGRSNQPADESFTGYPARQVQSMKNKNPLVEASSRIVVVYDDDGTLLA